VHKWTDAAANAFVRVVAMELHISGDLTRRWVGRRIAVSVRPRRRSRGSADDVLMAADMEEEVSITTFSAADIALVIMLVVVAAAAVSA
jgi:hypothetical protein